MKHKSNAVKTFGEISPRSKAKAGLRAGKAFYPPGQLDRAYVLALPVVSAAFGNNHHVAVLKLRELSNIPFACASKMEKDVSATLSGRIFFTTPKT